MTLLRKFWRSVKRNPVILAVLGSIVVQVAQDYTAGRIDTANIAKYILTLLLGLIARGLVTPAKEAEAARMKALSTPIATPGEKLPEDGSL